MTTSVQTPTRRGDCAVCGAYVVITKLGVARNHRTRRMSWRGPFIAEDVCLGSGQPPEPIEEAEQ